MVLVEPIVHHESVLRNLEGQRVQEKVTIMITTPDMVLSFTGESNSIARQRELVRRLLQAATPKTTVLFDVDFLDSFGGRKGKGRIEGVVATLIWLEDDTVLFVFSTGERLLIPANYVTELGS
jgi:hypothetical protein